MDAEEAHRGGRLGSSEESDVKEHVLRDRHQAHREVQEWKKGSKDQEERASKTKGSRSFSFRILEGFVRGMSQTWKGLLFQLPTSSKLGGVHREHEEECERVRS